MKHIQFILSIIYIFSANNLEPLVNEVETTVFGSHEESGGAIVADGTVERIGEGNSTPNSVQFALYMVKLHFTLVH